MYFGVLLMLDIVPHQVYYVHMLSDSQMKFVADVFVTIGEVSLASTVMQLFYLTIAILLLALAIGVYPTLRKRSGK